MESGDRPNGPPRPKIVVTVPPLTSREPPLIEIREPARPPLPGDLVARAGRHGSHVGVPDENPFDAIDDDDLAGLVEATLAGIDD